MTARSSLFIEQRTWGDIVIVGVHGHLEVETAPALSRAVAAILHRGRHRIVVNLADVIALDAAGLGELASVRALVADRRGELRLIVAGRQVREPLALTRLLDAFQVFPSEAEALANLTTTSGTSSRPPGRTPIMPGFIGRPPRIVK